MPVKIGVAHHIFLLPTQTRKKSQVSLRSRAWAFHFLCLVSIQSRETFLPYSPIQWEKIAQDVCPAQTKTNSEVSYLTNIYKGHKYLAEEYVLNSSCYIYIVSNKSRKVFFFCIRNSNEVNSWETQLEPVPMALIMSLLGLEMSVMNFRVFYFHLFHFLQFHNNWWPYSLHRENQ